MTTANSSVGLPKSHLKRRCCLGNARQKTASHAASLTACLGFSLGRYLVL